MFKKFLICWLLLVILPVLVNASSNSIVKVGGKYYESLEEAIVNATSTDTIMLISNIVLEDTLNINKTINLNLNGHDIIAPTKVFQVQGGTLNITGKGKIKEEQPDYGVIMVKGSREETDSSYSIINIGKDVTLEGWSGIFINHDSSKAYGIVVNLEGKINAVNDINGGNGIGIYVNGNIKDSKNAPVVNILEGAEITSTGNGLYIAGYSIFNIGKSYISGLQSGIGIKSGILNIDGATVVCQGKDFTPTEGYNNGMKASGTTIQIESNNGYAGNIEMNIKNGNFKSKNSHVIYEYIGKGNNSLVNSINVSGGIFLSESGKNVFSLSNSFKEKHPNFIMGGKYSSDPSSYLSPGYTSILENNLFHVTKNTIKEIVFNTKNIMFNPRNNIFKVLIIFSISTIFIILGYLNRRKIVSLFSK